MKIIIGAGKTRQDGWVPTQEDELNVLKRSDFDKLLGDNRAEAFLAEHVWEHMTYEEGVSAAKNCFDYLMPGGYIRAAVPDRYFKNEWYQNLVKVGGNGDPEHPAYTHKIVYDVYTFERVFQTAGFQVKRLEYCDEKGEFHYNEWDEADGRIGRSLRFDTRNQDGKLGMVSIIIDAVRT